MPTPIANRIIYVLVVVDTAALLFTVLTWSFNAPPEPPIQLEYLPY